MSSRTLGIVVGVIVLVVIGFVFFPLPQPIIELAPEAIFSIGGLKITNTILTAWVMIILIAVGLKLGTRNVKMIPSGFQNFFEFVIETFGNIVNGVAGEKNGRRFFPVVFILLLYIVLCNWAALTPLFNVIGKTENLVEHFEHEAHDHPEDVHEAEKLHGWIMKKGGITMVPLFQKTKYIEVEVPHGTNAERLVALEHELEEKLHRHLEEDEVYGFIAPFLRGVNTDVTAPLSYAIWSAIFVEFWGITALGLAGYGSKFFNFKKLMKGDIMNGLIDVFVGLLELISEASRLISFTFRLFGNISAGEILLFMMSFLVPFVLVDVFYGLELFVGLIQGFVFAMLTLVFGVMAVSGHGDHDEGHGDEHHDGGAHGQAHHHA